MEHGKCALSKGQIRKARKAARAAGRSYETGDYKRDPESRRDLSNQPGEFTESAAGYRARERWARHYDDLNGAPEGDWDR